MHWEDGGALKAIRQGGWDFVVLQEQSLLPINDPATMHSYARMFDAEIKKVGAKTVFFLTWARQNRPETQEALTDAYTKIAKELNALIAPVGLAWQNVFKENPKMVLHLPDQSHPNSAGSYLAACVFYSIFFARNPENLSGRIEGKSVKTDGRVNEETSELVNLNKADAAFLQRIAWQTVKAMKEARH
jgi:DNA uptake protein ComE-like DNA-binding protein